jgi:4-hydroxybenzoate polyprenyltransferase
MRKGTNRISARTCDRATIARMAQLSVGRQPSLVRPLELTSLLLRSGRPLSAGLAGALSFATVWIRSGFSQRAVLVGFVMWTVTMFGFVINDIFDFEKDVAARVRRPIAMGLLSRQMALVFAIVLLLVVWSLCPAVGSANAVVMRTVLALVLYTPFARHLPLFKGVYVAGLSLAPLYYASIISHVNFPGAAYGLLALFIFGRETLMDAHEIVDDRRAGVRTIAVWLGQTEARRLGTVMMILSLVGLNLVARGVMGRTLAKLAVASLFCIFVWPRVEERTRISFSRLPMLAAALALVSA